MDNRINDNSGHCGKPTLEWIRGSGRCKEAELDARLRGFEGAEGVIGFYSDGFLSAPGAHRARILEGRHKLLELRVYSPTQELWVYRSRLGDDFSWRLADDSGLAVPGPHAFTSRQRLDIAADLGENEIGCRRLRSTGGGVYTLPIREGDRYVRLVHYVRYDMDGVATAVDWRIRGFESERTEPETGVKEHAEGR